MIRHSFHAPLTRQELGFLTRATDINFMGQDTTDWLCVTGYDEDDRLLGMCVFEPKTWFDWHFSIAVADPRCINRRVMQAMFRAVFTLAVRVTALVSPDNRPALKGVKQLGFQYEGFIRMGVEGTRDALMFGMLRDDCRFLPGYRGTGSITPTDLAGEHHGLVA